MVSHVGVGLGCSLGVRDLDFDPSRQVVEERQAIFGEVRMLQHQNSEQEAAVREERRRREFFWQSFLEFWDVEKHQCS